MSRINNLLRRPIAKKMRARLENKNFSLFCNNCTGAMILHDLGVQFNSPCVNLFIEEPYYLKFIQNLPHYQKQRLVFFKTDKPYPVAKLDDIVIDFMHYSSNEEAEQKWYERFSRVNYDNIFFMLHQREKCTDDILREFDSLPFENKVMFVSKPYTELKSAFYFKDRQTPQGYLDHIYPYKGKLTGKRYYDDFDYVSWFNSKR